MNENRQPHSQPAQSHAPRPYVSVIVPVYNAETMIGECIEALLNQDYPKDRYEVIVVDNDSTDRTAEVIKRYPVKYVLEDKTHTSYAARNTGARHAKGETLAFCDADQIAVRAWLSALLRRWSDPAYGAFAGEVVPAEHDSSFLSRYAALDENAYLQHWKHNPNSATVGSGNMALRRELFERLGGFRTNVPSGADLLLGWGVTKDLGFKIAYEPDALMHHRLRTTRAALLRREKRLAFGREYLSRHFGVKGRSPLVATAYSLGRATRSLAVGLVYSVYRTHPEAGWKRYASLMNVRMTLAHLSGIWAYHLGKGETRGIR